MKLIILIDKYNLSSTKHTHTQNTTCQYLLYGTHNELIERYKKETGGVVIQTSVWLDTVHSTLLHISNKTRIGNEGLYMSCAYTHLHGTHNIHNHVK